jgi:hypothetical protein
MKPVGALQHLYYELPGGDAGPVYRKKSCGTATRSETVSLAATLVQVNEAVSSSSRSEFDACFIVAKPLIILRRCHIVSGDVISTAVCVRRRQILIIISNKLTTGNHGCIRLIVN